MWPNGNSGVEVQTMTDTTARRRGQVAMKPHHPVKNTIQRQSRRIDADVVIRILQKTLEDFRRFETEALRWLPPA
jgi:hypothetical protein